MNFYLLVTTRESNDTLINNNVLILLLTYLNLYSALLPYMEGTAPLSQITSQLWKEI